MALALQNDDCLARHMIHQPVRIVYAPGPAAWLAILQRLRLAEAVKRRAHDVPQQEIDEVKSRLRDYAQQVNSGEREFSTLAILYSQDQSTAVYGGETGFQSRSVLLPEYATAAFNLNDNK